MKSQLRVTFPYRVKPLNQSIPLSLLSAKWVGGGNSVEKMQSRCEKKCLGHPRPVSNDARMLATC